MRRLLVPYDGSEPSRGAFTIAAELARRTGAEVVVAHAVELPPMLLTAPSLDDSIEQLLGEGEKHWRQELGRLIESAPEGVAVRAVVKAGPAITVLGDLVTSEQPDLVLAGTHGVGGARRVLLGRVSQRLLETCERPILFVREHREDGSAGFPASADRVLVAIDGSKDSEAGLELAVSLARELGFGLKLVHVIDPFLPGYGLIDVQSLRHEFQEQARARLADARERIDAEFGLDVSEEVREGRPGSELAEACGSDPEVAFAVVGTRGIQGFSGLFVGSVARDLVNHAPTPVLVVRRPEADQG